MKLPKILFFSLVLWFFSSCALAVSEGFYYSSNGSGPDTDFKPTVNFEELELHNSDFANYADVDIDYSYNNDIIVIQNHGSAIDTNKAKVLQRGAENSLAYISQNGSGNIGLIEQQGSDNVALLVQTGNHHKGQITQFGDDNLALLVQKVAGSEISLSQTGNRNTALVVDYGGSSYGINQTGSHSYVSVVSNMHKNISVKQ